MDAQARKYNQAAIGYVIYGVIYLAGAIYLGRIGQGPGGTVWWYLIGAAMAFGFPYLIWKRLKWVTRILVPRRSGFDRLPGPTVKRGRPESEPVKFTATRY